MANRRSLPYVFATPRVNYDFEIPITYTHRIRFTRDAFSPDNPVVADLLDRDRDCKVIVYVETEIVRGLSHATLFPAGAERGLRFLGADR